MRVEVGHLQYAVPNPEVVFMRRQGEITPEPEFAADFQRKESALLTLLPLSPIVGALIELPG